MKAATTADKRASIARLVHFVSSVPGLAAECGVYQGASLRTIAEACPERQVIGFDTFAGLPAEAWEPGEGHDAGEFGDSSLALVQSHVADLPNIMLVDGIFPASAAGMDVERFALVHLDLDFYISTRDAIAWLLPRMSPGGLLVFDDYRWPYCPGVERAIAEAGLTVIETAPYQVAHRVPL